MPFTTDTALAILTVVSVLVGALAGRRTFRLKRLETAARLVTDHDPKDARFTDLNRAIYLKCYRDAFLSDPRWLVMILGFIIALSGTAILGVTVWLRDSLLPITIGVFVAYGLILLVIGLHQIWTTGSLEKSTRVRILEWIHQEEEKISQRILNALDEKSEDST